MHIQDIFWDAKPVIPTAQNGFHDEIMQPSDRHLNVCFLRVEAKWSGVK